MFTRALILVSGLAFSLALNAATEFENGLVPLELVRDANNGGGSFYKTLPDNFPVVALPAGAGLSVIGSVVRGGSQFVLLRNSRSGAEALQTLLAAYSAAGWVNLGRAPLVTLCHDQHGMLEISASDTLPGEYRVYLSRSLYPFGGPGVSLNCAQQQAYNQGGGPNAMLDFIRGLLPMFDMPEGTLGLPNRFPGVGISSGYGFVAGANSFEAHQDYSIDVPDTTIPELHEHFVQQLEDQGWAIDSNGVGEFSSSSIGFKIAQTPATPVGPASEIKLTGYITVLNIEDDTYNIQFNLHGGDGSSSGFIERGPINSPSLGIRGIPTGFVPLGVRGISP